MEIIKKKINLEQLKSHTFGMAYYIPVNVAVTGNFPFEQATGTCGNWGGIICDSTYFDDCGPNISTLSLLEKYYKVRNITQQTGITLKKFIKNGQRYYTSIFDDDIRYFDYIIQKETMFSDLGKGVFKERGTAETVNDDFIKLVSDEDYNTYTNLGGRTLINKVEVGLLGLISVPSSIKGVRVPNKFYVSQIPVWLKWFQDNEDRVKTPPVDCCALNEWDERGGDEMYFFLQQNSIAYQEELRKWERLRIGNRIQIPTVSIPILLTQTYDDNGTMSVYEHYGDSFAYQGGTAHALTPSATTFSPGYIAESRLKELRTREKVFSMSGDNAGELLPFRWADSAKTETEVPFIEGELFNCVPTTTSNTYIADYVTKINCVSSETGGFIIFEYVFGGKVTAQTQDGVIVAMGAVTDGNGNYTGEGGIKYRENYTFRVQTIELEGTTYTYKEIDFNNNIFTIYNKDFELNRDGYLSRIIGFTTADVWRGESATDAPVVKKEYLNHISEEPKINVDLEIERGGASAFENHFKLSECNTFEDVAQYGNNFFNLR